MRQTGNHEVLNRLLTVLHRSLPVYLTYASPWTRRGEQRAVELIKHIAEDQEQLVNRIRTHVMDHYGPVDVGSYPLDFPDTNDLAFDFLLRKLVACQKQDLDCIEQCAQQISGDAEAKSLAEEALGSARGYLESLEELAAEVSKAGTATWVKQ